MAELNPKTACCCTASEQAPCCEPSAKTACCGQDEAQRGCAAGRTSTGVDDVREEVRSRYAAAATQVAGSATLPTRASTWSSPTA